VGLISGIFKLPLAPVAGTVWIAEKVLEQAEAQYYDESAIQSQLREIEAAREAGDISEADAEQAEEELLERLLEGRARGVGT
jgi:Gas vesicle protein G